MRTTVDLPDDLLTSVKVAAAERGISLKSLFISALHRELETGRTDISLKRVRMPLVPTRHPDDLIAVSNDDIEQALADTDADIAAQ
ncbi:hypothetical protein [Gordonia spumicola]|nr:hypothetical protein [Gordonia spumicola]